MCPPAAMVEGAQAAERAGDDSLWMTGHEARGFRGGEGAGTFLSGQPLMRRYNAGECRARRRS
jgi:hypothetical protein